MAARGESDDSLDTEITFDFHELSTGNLMAVQPYRFEPECSSSDDDDDDDERPPVMRADFDNGDMRRKEDLFWLVFLFLSNCFLLTLP